jgi:3-phenylpropionate/trans-cinnamate dioxygenase ferredoxin subunit
VPNEFHVAALDDIKPGELKRVDPNGVPVCLARLLSGEVYAMSDICSHEEIELSDGDLDGREVECPAHGSRFSVDDGSVSGVPAVFPVPVYPVRVDDDQIYVQLDGS